MLERCFKTDSTARLLRDGPAGPFLDGLAQSMFAGGYSCRTVGSYVHDADHLAQWAARRGVAVANLDKDLLAGFVHHLPRCRCRCRGRRRGAHRHVAFRVHALLRYLCEEGVVTTSVPEATCPQLVRVSQRRPPADTRPRSARPYAPAQRSHRPHRRSHETSRRDRGGDGLWPSPSWGGSSRPER
jgi:hypothetical protein